MGILCIGSLIMMIVYGNMSSRSVARTRQAINIESTKYISRSPTPCSWRLHTLRQCVERGDSQLMYYDLEDVF
ncbi:unnamed protein product [Rotaria sp. Silwood1]|nr:unnamed protein product [Rotaria sp. Silwood1]